MAANQTPLERFMNRYVRDNIVSPTFTENIQQADGFVWLRIFEREYDGRMEAVQNAWIARDATTLYQLVFVWSTDIYVKVGDCQCFERARCLTSAIEQAQVFSWDERLLFEFTNLLFGLRSLMRITAIMLQPPQILSDISRSSTSSEESRDDEFVDFYNMLHPWPLIDENVDLDVMAQQEPLPRDAYLDAAIAALSLPLPHAPLPASGTKGGGGTSGTKGPGGGTAGTKGPEGGTEGGIEGGIETEPGSNWVLWGAIRIVVAGMLVLALKKKSV